MRGHSIARLIFEQVAAAYEIPVDHINRGSHRRPYPDARKEIAYRLRNERAWSLKQIGNALKVHHSSVVAMLHTYKPRPTVAAPATPEPSTIRLTAVGQYPREMPPALVRALTESVHQHMEAYGLDNIEVKQENR